MEAGLALAWWVSGVGSAMVAIGVGEIVGRLRMLDLTDGTGWNI